MAVLIRGESDKDRKNHSLGRGGVDDSGESFSTLLGLHNR